MDRIDAKVVGEREITADEKWEQTLAAITKLAKEMRDLDRERCDEQNITDNDERMRFSFHTALRNQVEHLEQSANAYVVWEMANCPLPGGQPLMNLMNHLATAVAYGLVALGTAPMGLTSMRVRRLEKENLQ